MIFTPPGAVRAFLLKDGKRLTLDDAAAGDGPVADSITINGGAVSGLGLDLAKAKIADARGKLGSLGKRIEISGGRILQGGVVIEKTLSAEVYDDFPGMAVVTAEYKNAEHGGFAYRPGDDTAASPLRLSQRSAGAAPYQLWSFQGSSYAWGKDDVLPLSKRFLSAQCDG